MTSPLANMLRPKTLKDVIGQTHLLGEHGPIKKMADRNSLISTVLWGPPGTGKTTIVLALANDTKSCFIKLNATESTVKDLRKVISEAQERKPVNTILFVDELHRWNKSQQDVVLPVVEDGTIILFGATTENPKFAINSTILSRCIVLEAKPLNDKEMITLIQRVRSYYKSLGIKVAISQEAARMLINRSSGDARKCLTALQTCIEILAEGSNEKTVEEEHVTVAMPSKHMVFDAAGQDHFDLAHCFQEALQHSDGDSAIFWLAKWLSSGEEPAYICRRMLITAFEDCAANPTAAILAMAASYAAERTGMPECMIPMAMATIEIAKSDRDKTAYNAIKAAMHDVQNGTTVHVPEEMRAGTYGNIPVAPRKYIEDHNAN